MDRKRRMQECKKKKYIRQTKFVMDFLFQFKIISWKMCALKGQTRPRENVNKIKYYCIYPNGSKNITLFYRIINKFLLLLYITFSWIYLLIFFILTYLIIWNHFNMLLILQKYRSSIYIMLNYLNYLNMI